MFRSILTQRLLTAFETAGVALPEGFQPSVVLASDTRYGDYQSNAPMVLAKQLRTNPRALAQQIVDALSVTDLCEKVSIDGPGFLNFTLAPATLASRLLSTIEDPQIGVPHVASPHTIVVDFSAPNIAKPMHVGHIRSTIIGDCLARVAKFVGHHVITDNHIGDWGTQFGMILHGWKTQLDSDALEANPIAELLRLYKTVNAETKADASVLDICRHELVQLQQGDSKNLSIWKRCIDLSLSQLKIIYERLDIHFDHYLGESHYNEKLAPLVDELLANGIAEISDGAVCIFFREIEALADKPCIIRKTDGGFLYATTDLATIDLRIKDWQADEIWYVVGAPQELHFRQLFEATRKRGHDAHLVHIAFGSILGQDGKMFRTRSGESVGLIEVLDEAIERAKARFEEVENDQQFNRAISDHQQQLPSDTVDQWVRTQPPKNYSDEEKTTIAETIGIGAVKYAELSQNRLTDYKFSWDKMLSLQGNTAPYLINAYVRTRAIFRKLGSDFQLPAEATFTEPSERALALKLAQFAEAVHDVLEDHRPNTLATYLYELANAYHSFYEACPVLRSEGTMRETRLLLCEATSRVLRIGLQLMGIKVTDRM